MNRLLALIAIFGAAATISAQDITTLEKIGPVVNLERTGNRVTLNCQDNSQVQL